MIKKFYYRQYTLPVITVLADPVAGGSVSGGGIFSYGTVTQISATPNTGWTFLKWDDDNSNATRNITVTSSKTYTALFTSPTYTVTYNGNNNTGGAVPIDQYSPYNTGSTVTVLGNVNNLVKTGYTFNGWNTAADGTGTSYNSGDTFTISGNITLYALWLTAVYNITVSVDPSQGGLVSGGGSFNYGATTQISTTPNTGYNFVQWSDGWRELTRTIIVTESKNYIAQYTNSTGPFTVTFNLNGHGSGTAPSLLILDSTTGYYATEPTTPTDSNYTFNGWFPDSDCTGQKWSFTNDQVNINLTLYAGWVKNTSQNVPVNLFSSNPSGDNIPYFKIGKTYSEDPNSPIGTNYVGRANASLSCTVNENDIWGNPRVHGCACFYSNNYFKRGQRCIFKLYLGGQQTYYDGNQYYEFVGLSINQINNGKLLQAQGIRNFDMPYCASQGDPPLTQVSCYYYEFAIDTAGPYVITPLFRLI